MGPDTEMTTYTNNNAKTPEKEKDFYSMSTPV
jgi:hypothetical protein